MAKKITITRKENKLVWGLHSLPIADGEKYGYSVLDKVIYIAGENTINVYKIDSPKKAVATREYKNTKILKLFRGRGYVFFIYCYTDENGNLEYYQGRLMPNAGCTDLVALNRTDSKGNLIDFIEKESSQETEDKVENIEKTSETNESEKSDKEQDDYDKYLENPSERQKTTEQNREDVIEMDEDEEDEDSLM